MEAICKTCGHRQGEHIGGQLDCDHGNCSCMEFEPIPDPSYKWRVRQGHKTDDSCGD